MVNFGIVSDYLRGPGFGDFGFYGLSPSPLERGGYSFFDFDPFPSLFHFSPVGISRDFYGSLFSPSFAGFGPDFFSAARIVSTMGDAILETDPFRRIPWWMRGGLSFIAPMTPSFILPTATSTPHAPDIFARPMHRYDPPPSSATSPSAVPRRGDRAVPPPPPPSHFSAEDLELTPPPPRRGRRSPNRQPPTTPVQRGRVTGNLRNPSKPKQTPASRPSPSSSSQPGNVQWEEKTVTPAQDRRLTAWGKKQGGNVFHYGTDDKNYRVFLLTRQGRAYPIQMRPGSGKNPQWILSETSVGVVAGVNKTFYFHPVS